MSLSLQLLFKLELASDIAFCPCRLNRSAFEAVVSLRGMSNSQPEAQAESSVCRWQSPRVLRVGRATVTFGAIQVVAMFLLLNMIFPASSPTRARCQWGADAAPLDPAQRAALIDLYNSTAGFLWTNSSGWMSGDPCGAGWYGVKCDPGNNEVM